MLRLARLEERFNALVARMDAHLADSARNREVASQQHQDALDLISKLDARADKTDLAFARLFAGIAIAIWLGQLAAPYILHALGAPAQ